MSEYNNYHKSSVRKPNAVVDATKKAWQNKMKGVWERRKIIYNNYWLKKLKQKQD